MLTIAFPNAASYVAGETKRASWQVPLAFVSGLLVITVPTLIMGYLTYSVFGYDFIAATGYYSLTGASGYSLPGMATPSYFMTILYPNPLFAIFMMITGVTWTILILSQAALCATRAFFSWSFDRLVPSFLADISEKTHTPVKATIVTVLIGVFFLVTSAYNFFGTTLPSALGYTLAYMITMIAGIVYPFYRKGIFGASPSVVRRKIAGIPLISLFGVIGALACLVTSYFFVLLPSVSGITSSGVLTAIGFYIVAVLIYYGVKAVRKSQGIDLDLVFKQLPPE
jgi:amino acid transporter